MDYIDQKDVAVGFKNVKSIAEIFKYIPGLTLMLYISSIIKLYVFYQTFDFNILPYLDFTELLTRLADDLILISIVLLIIVVTVNLFGNSNIIKSHFSRAVDGEPSKPSKIFNRFMISLMLVSAAGIVLCLIFLNGNYPGKFFTYISEIICYTGTGSALMYQNFLNKEPKMISKYARKIIAWGFLFFALLFITVSIATLDSIGYTLHSSKDSYIETKDKRIVSTDNYYYIGSTKSFVLFYNETKNVVDLFPMSTITKISIKKN